MAERKSANAAEGQEVMTERSLGRALALLEARAEGLNPAPKFFVPGEDEFISSLRDRRDKLRAHPDLMQSLFKTIPRHGCEREYSFLADNPDYFLVYLTNATAKDSTGDYLRLFEHMNNCYMCFEEYSLTLRDYHQMTQELRGRGKTNDLN